MPMRRDTNHTLRQLFMAKVKITDGCWLWEGNIMVHGYGRLQYMHKSLRAHRVAYELLVEPIPEGMSVCHHCDNPRCVRPDHLFVGSTADNLRDMAAKGRGDKRGERNGRAKVTVEQVAEIRRLYAAGGVTQQRLGYLFGLTQAHVSAILRGVSWNPNGQGTGRSRGKPRLTPDEVRAIRTAKGKVRRDYLARQYGLHPSTISSIWSRKIWTEIPDWVHHPLFHPMSDHLGRTVITAVDGRKPNAI